jgi:hypothetical protein
MEHPQPQPGPVVPPPPPPFPPGSYPPVALVYHQPVTVPRPTGVTVLAIIGIVLAALWILTGLGGVLSLMVMFAFVTPGMMPANFADIRAVMLWNGVSAVISGLIAAWLLTVAIGCLRMRPWGRSGIVYYAVVDLAWVAIKLVVALAWVLPTQQRWMNSMMKTMPPATSPASPASPPAPSTGPAAMSAPVVTVMDTDSTTTTSPMPTSPAAAMTTVGLPFDVAPWVMAIVTASVSAIYPAVVLLYMTRPRIKGAFTPVAPGFPGTTDGRRN